MKQVKAIDELNEGPGIVCSQDWYEDSCTI